MATITIRKLDASIVNKLKRLAKTNKRSLEAEARRILEQEVSMPARRALTIKRALQWQKRLAGRVKGDSTNLIREARYRE